ncbi:MAG: anti-phage ZorAB system protein ZorA [Betaproteobacteria bacterium]
MGQVAVFIQEWLPFVHNMHGVPLWVVYVVLAAFAAFLVVFVPKAIYIGIQLRWKGSRVKKMREKAGPKTVDPDDVAKLMRREPYRHLWSEYDDTLHRVRRYRGSENETVEVRATALAESFFTRETLVDSRLLDEFVRHLPGILTGLGIIGTFAGLLSGLEGFKPSEDASTARESLQRLLEGVGHAFYASAIAIACAMIITLFEKVLIALCYTGVERLSHAVDSLYNTGAGEEYLSRLVEASETNAAQTSQLKDALVEDLKTMMTNLVERQIAAQKEETERLGERIGKSIADGLTTPMQQLMGVVEKASGQQGTQVEGMLNTLLTAFMAKLEDTFGKQFHGINDALLQSQQAMQSVQAAVAQLVGDIGKAGETAASQMSAKLEEAMTRAAVAQERMNDQMREFVVEIRRLIEEQQAASKAALDQAVQSVLEKMGDAMSRLAEDRHAASVADQARQDSLKAQTTELYGGLATDVGELLKGVSESAQLTQESIAALERVTTKAIDGMSAGAENMNVAATKFTDAGNAVTDVLSRSGELGKTLTGASQALSQSAQAVQTAFEQYDRTRATIERMVGELGVLVENAKREAGVSAGLVQEMDKLLASVKGIETETSNYLKEVNGVLQTAFQSFGTQLANQVATTMTETDKHTSSAISSLTGIVQELGATLQRLRRT